MAINYNEKQRKTLELINDFLHDPIPKYFYLFGYAGTGKTFIISQVIKKLIQDKVIDHIFTCASTHKALSVISSYFRSSLTIQEEIEFSERVTTMTLQKLLDYKPVIDNESGKKIFKAKQESKFLKKIESKLIIIDECSMVSRDMISDLNKYADMYPIKIIFLGDDAQLRPVNEKISLVFSSVPPEYKYHIVLDEVMRTKKSEIKEVCTIIRQWNQKESLAKLLLPIHNQKKTFKLYHQKKEITETTWFKQFIKKKESGTMPIILTWRNDKAIMYNNLIRQYIHKIDPEASPSQVKTLDLTNYISNDYVVFNDFYSSTFDSSIFYTSDIVKICQTSTEKKILFVWTTLNIPEPKNPLDKAFNLLLIKLDAVPLELKVDKLIVEKIHSDFAFADHNTHPIQTISRSDLTKYEEAQEIIRTHLEMFYKKYKSDLHSSRLWNAFHKHLKEAYADIIFGYSMTTHKSQASTFGSVLIDAEDICENPEKDEMKEMLYTASSRAADDLSFIIA